MPDPVKPTSASGGVTASVKKEKTEAQTLLENATTILKEYGMKETNVPINSPYWDMMNRYRALQNKV